MEAYGLCLREAGCGLGDYTDYMHACWHECKQRGASVCSHPGADSLIKVDGLDAALEQRAINGTTVMVAMTNAGYVDYTANLYRSLERLGMEAGLLIFCLNSWAKERLAKMGIASLLLNDGEYSAEFMDQHTKRAFAVICAAKLRIVHLLLSKGYDVVFTDGDVVFLRDPLPVVQAQIEAHKVDAIFMCDSETVEMEPRINSGFYWMRSTPKTVELYDPQRVASIYNLQKDVGTRIIGDQNYIKSNIVRDRIPYAILPLPLFANGAYWMSNADDVEAQAYLVHFTHIKGHDKRARMQARGLWWLADGGLGSKKVEL